LITIHLGAVYAFLYIPIAVLMALSLNQAGMPTAWTGVSFEWYGKLASNPKILSAAWNSVIVAGLSSGLATIIGAMLDLGV
jgi:spermidine/putrescine transport system permease protein